MILLPNSWKVFSEKKIYHSVQASVNFQDIPFMQDSCKQSLNLVYLNNKSASEMITQTTTDLRGIHLIFISSF